MDGCQIEVAEQPNPTKSYTKDQSKDVKPKLAVALPNATICV
jgi:hypothetical protein